MIKAGAGYMASSLGMVLVLAACSIGWGALVSAEVVGSTSPELQEEATAVHTSPVSLQCWQKGRRIIQQKGLRGLAVNAVSKKGSVAFRRAGSEQPEIFLLPFEDGLCLVGPEN